MNFSHGILGVVMAIQTFDEYLNCIHSYIHALVSDGLFMKSHTFYVMPEVHFKPMEESFRAKALVMLKEEGKLFEL